MTGGVADALLLLVAGVGAGLAGSVAGLASLVSYPALLATGLPPVAANATNTVALVLSGVGSALGSRPELRGQRPRLRRLLPVAVAGGLVGAALLLLTPAPAFERLVPWLVGGASAVVLLPRRPAPREQGPPRPDPPALYVGTAAVGVYGGYFGAAAGVLLLALLLATTSEGLARSNAAKNAVLALANGVAAVVFAVAGPVDWVSAAPLAAGFLVGGRTGPALVRRAPAGPLRVAIGLCGLALAAALALDAR